MKPVGLKRLPFFGDLPRWALVRLVEAAREEELPAGRTVLHQHDRTRTFTSCPPAHPRSMSVSVTTTCWWRCWVTRASWSAFRPPYRATASVRCEQSSRLLTLPVAAFQELFERDPGLGYLILGRVAAGIADRLEQARERLLAVPRQGPAGERP